MRIRPSFDDFLKVNVRLHGAYGIGDARPEVRAFPIAGPLENIPFQIIHAERVGP